MWLHLGIGSCISRGVTLAPCGGEGSSVPRWEGPGLCVGKSNTVGPVVFDGDTLGRRGSRFSSKSNVSVLPSCRQRDLHTAQAGRWPSAEPLRKVREEGEGEREGGKAATAVRPWFSFAQEVCRILSKTGGHFISSH